MALSGVSEAKVKVLGRWAWEAMLRYVRETILLNARKKLAKQVVGEAAVARTAQQVHKSPGKWQKWPKLPARQCQLEARQCDTDSRIRMANRERDRLIIMPHV